jgi:hypothetical protein
MEFSEATGAPGYIAAQNRGILWIRTAASRRALGIVPASIPCRPGNFCKEQGILAPEQGTRPRTNFLTLREADENNAVATWNQWSKTYMDRKDWKAAIGIFEKGLERFPDNGTLTHNIKYCREQVQKGG